MIISFMGEAAPFGLTQGEEALNDLTRPRHSTG